MYLSRNHNKGRIPSIFHTLLTQEHAVILSLAKRLRKTSLTSGLELQAGVVNSAIFLLTHQNTHS